LAETAKTDRYEIKCLLANNCRDMTHPAKRFFSLPSCIRGATRCPVTVEAYIGHVRRLLMEEITIIAWRSLGRCQQVETASQSGDAFGEVRAQLDSCYFG
jgi:hypothetical protein